MKDERKMKYERRKMKEERRKMMAIRRARVCNLLCLTTTEIDTVSGHFLALFGEPHKEMT
jgi:hypothetical protein